MPRAQGTRRGFLAAAAALAAIPVTGVRAAAKFKRSIVTSPEGQKALVSYAKGVEAMLKLPADDPRNWFRNAFIHLMDCPHGNWWFYIWHRGYLGYFEETIRSLSGDPDFALPYWDWTQFLTPPPSPTWGIPDFFVQRRADANRRRFPTLYSELCCLHRLHQADTGKILE